MPEPKAQLIDPQGPIDVPGMQVTGVTTATGGFVGAVQGAATGFNTTTVNVSAGIITATKFSGNTTGNVSGLADDTNINVGIITSTSFTGDLVGNAAGLSTTTANINAGIMSATSFAGNFTGVASGITGTPNIVVGIMTGTLKGDGSSLTGIAATNWITNNVTANSSTTTVDLNNGNTVIFTQSSNTTVSFANTGTSNIVTFIRKDDNSGTDRTITWPDSIKWDGGEAPTLVNNTRTSDVNVINLLTRDEGVTWYGWETVNNDPQTHTLWSWGFCEVGDLGLNQAGPTAISSPTQIPGTTWTNLSGSTPRGATFGYFGKSDNTLWTFGQNAYGQLGLNNVTYYSSPVQIPGTTWGSTMDTVYAGIRQGYSVKTDSTLWAWGYNNYGELAQNDRTQRSSPVQIPGTWSKCVGGVYIGGGIKTDGSLWMWGRNQHGQLGQNQAPAQLANTSSPVQIPGTTWNTIDGGESYWYATKTDGTAWWWGQEEYGQSGLNNPVNSHRSSPTQIPGTTWSNIHASGGGMGIKTDGTLWTWGGNWNGALGLNQAEAQLPRNSSPTQIPGTTWSDAIGVTGNHPRLGLKTDGTLWGWGGGSNGSLGLNDRTNYSSPTQVPGTDWSSISFTYNSTKGLKKA